MQSLSEKVVAAALVNNRHAWIERYCNQLHRIEVGNIAKQLLETDLPERGGLLEIPMWVWRPPLINMGRKSINKLSREVLDMPVRVHTAALRLVTDDVSFPYLCAGLGHKDVSWVNAKLGLVETENIDLDKSGEITVRTLTKGALKEKLTALVADGHASHWELRMWLESYVESIVEYAVRSVSYDVFGDKTSNLVLDEAGRQEVVDLMVLGNEDTPGRLLLLMNRTLEPGAFANVDPLKYVTTDLHRSAEEEVRKKIKDPRIGRKVRKIKRENPHATLEEIVEIYRRAHPRDNLAASRAATALTSSGLLEATAISIDLIGDNYEYNAPGEER